MKSPTPLVLFLAAGVGISGARPLAGQVPSFGDELLMQARDLASAVPGVPPQAVHYLPFGELKAPIDGLVDGAGNELVTGVYTVFQIRYSNGSIMIDAGIDREAEPDTTVTIFQDRYERVQRALEAANLIVVTHEHHDHVAGVIRSSRPNTVVPKTVLTRAQVQTLLDRPNVPLIRLTPEAAARYTILEYERLYPLAPGVVLIRAPGHTPGSQMVYVRLMSGAEYLFIGDIVWMMAGLERRRQKPEAVSHDLNEDRVLLQQQIEWLAGLTSRHGVVLVNGHDDNWLKGLVRRGLLRDGLESSR